MSASKQKGTGFETSLLPAIQGFWPGAERRAQQGALDKGDFIMPGNTLYVIEAKNEKTMKLPEWIGEARDEAFNARVPFGVVVHKRRGVTAPHQQWATMEFGDWLVLAEFGRGR